MLQAARRLVVSRLAVSSAAECAQQPLDVPCRMFSSARAALAVGRWDQIAELFQLPDQESAQEGKDGQPVDQSAADLAENAPMSAPPEGATPRESTISAHDTDTIIDLTEEEKRELIISHKRACDAVKQHYQGELPPGTPVVNHGGAGRSGWCKVEEDEESGEELWELDLTGGRVPDNENNALLSREAKTLMVWMAENGFDVEHIAKHFRIRQQRVMAILALDKIEREKLEAGEKLHWEFEEVMEGGRGLDPEGNDGEVGFYDCDEIVGSGERHVKILPRAPHYEEKHRKADPNFTWEALEDKLAEQEEAQMILEFTDRLAFNLGDVVGKTIKRNITRSHRPKRPKEGFSLLIKPLGQKEEPFVADASGRVRPLTRDEDFLQHRRRVRPRRKLIPR